MKDILEKIQAIETGPKVIKTKPVRIQKPTKKLIQESIKLEQPSEKKGKTLVESENFIMTDPKLASILRRFPHEVDQFEKSKIIKDDLYDALYNYYFSSKLMPHGIAVGRDGDPMQWIIDKLEEDLQGNTEELTEEELNELTLFGKPQQQIRAMNLSPEEKRKRAEADKIWQRAKKSTEGSGNPFNSSISSRGDSLRGNEFAWRSEHGATGLGESDDNDIDEGLLMEDHTEEILFDILTTAGLVKNEDYVFDHGSVVVFGEDKADEAMDAIEADGRINDEISSTHISGITFRISFAPNHDFVEEAITDTEKFKIAGQTGDYSGRGEQMLALDAEYAKLKAEKDNPRCNMQRALEINNRMQEIKKEKYNLAAARLKDKATMDQMNTPSNWAAKPQKQNVFASVDGEVTFEIGDCARVIGKVEGAGKVGEVVHVGKDARFIVLKFKDDSRSSYHNSDLEKCEDDLTDDDDEDFNKTQVHENVNLNINASGEDEVADLIARIKGINGDNVSLTLSASNGEDVASLVKSVQDTPDTCSISVDTPDVVDVCPSMDFDKLLSAINQIESGECEEVDEANEHGQWPTEMLPRNPSIYPLDSAGGSKTYPKVAGGDNPMNEAKKLAEKYMRMLNS
jgi:hypothetical protein